MQRLVRANMRQFSCLQDRKLFVGVAFGDSDEDEDAAAAEAHSSRSDAALAQAAAVDAVAGAAATDSAATLAVPAPVASPAANPAANSAPAVQHLDGGSVAQLRQRATARWAQLLSLTSEERLQRALSPAAAEAARGTGADALVLDDGFQDPSLKKSLSLVVADGRHGFGNGFMIPAGPLRETVRAGLARADALVIMGDDAWGLADAVRRFGPPGLPVLTARVRPGPEVAEIAKDLCLAFAGIGHPDKFFQTLMDHGCRLAGHRAFPDHHPYSRADLDALRRRAEALKARLVTTEKDVQRIPREARGDIEVLTITLEWDDEAALDRLLQSPFS